MSIRTALLVLVLGWLGTGCGGGGAAPAEAPPADAPALALADVGEDLNAIEARALPPILVSAPGLPAAVEVGEVVRFRVTARVRQFRDGERVTIALQNPPPGCTCPTVEKSGVEATASGRWVVNSLWTGPVRLQFRIATAQSGVFRRSFDVQVVGSRLQAGQELQQSAGLRVGDVTGDGRVDVVALATSDGPGETGALHVFAGADTLGTKPTAILRDPLGGPGDRLGTDGDGSGIPEPGSESAYVHLVDITRDGILDVVVAVPFSDRGAPDAGAIFIWRGGAALAGTPAPFAVLQAATPVADARVGHNRFVGSLLFADVVGDGALDVVAAAPADRTAPSQEGSVLVWQGGPALEALTPGTVVAETARFTAPAVVDAPACGAGPVALRSADVTGDGRRDLVVSGWLVFAGGSDVTGTRLPTATLPAVGYVGETTFGSGARDAIRLGDVTGDGIADIVRKDLSLGILPNFSFGSVWRGGPGLSGNQLPTHRLLEDAPNGLEAKMPYGFRLHDISGDGVLDILVLAPQADQDRGEVRVWTAAHLVQPVSKPILLRGSTATAQLGLGEFSADPLVIADLTGDGIDDVIVPHGTPGSGRIEVFAGGSALDGPSLSLLSADFILVTEPGVGYDPTGFGRAKLQVEDLDGDTRLDVVLSGGLGFTYLSAWRGRAAPSGLLPPDAHFDIALLTPASTFDPLGNNALGLQIADVDRDGKPDVIVVRNPSASTSSPVARVCFGATLFSPAPTSMEVALGVAQSGIIDGPSGSVDGLHGARVPLLLADLTGDRRLELIGAAPRTDAVGLQSGMVAVWDIGAQLSSTSNPLGLPAHRVTGSAVAGRHLPAEARGVQGIFVADLTGDGVVELLVVDPLAASGDGEISHVRGGTPFPTGALGGVSGRFFAGTQADGLGR